MGEEEVNVRCDVTGKELMWSAARRAREEDVTHFLDFGVHAQFDAQTAVAKCGVTPVDTKRLDTDKAFDGSQCK